MIITEGTTFTITTETQGVELKMCSKPYYILNDSIEGWLDESPESWKDRKLIIETDYPITIKGDLKTRSYVHTNHPLTVKGQNLRGLF